MLQILPPYLPLFSDLHQMKYYFHYSYALCLALLLVSCTEPVPPRQTVQPAPPAPATPAQADNMGQYSGVLFSPPGYYTLDLLPGKTSAVVTLGDITYRLGANHSATRKKRTLANLDLEMTTDPGEPGDPLLLEFVLDGQPMKRTLFRVADQPDVHNYLSASSALAMNRKSYTLLRMGSDGLPVATSGKVHQIDAQNIRLEAQASGEVLELRQTDTGWTGSGVTFVSVD